MTLQQLSLPQSTRPNVLALRLRTMTLCRSKYSFQRLYKAPGIKRLYHTHLIYARARKKKHSKYTLYTNKARGVGKWRPGALRCEGETLHLPQLYSTNAASAPRMQGNIPLASKVPLLISSPRSSPRPEPRINISKHVSCLPPPRPRSPPHSIPSFPPLPP